MPPSPQGGRKRHCHQPPLGGSDVLSKKQVGQTQGHSGAWPEGRSLPPPGAPPRGQGSLNAPPSPSQARAAGLTLPWAQGTQGTGTELCPPPCALPALPWGEICSLKTHPLPLFFLCVSILGDRFPSSKKRDKPLLFLKRGLHARAPGPTGRQWVLLGPGRGRAGPGPPMRAGLAGRGGDKGPLAAV
jgi:hypothetical protein